MERAGATMLGRKGSRYRCDGLEKEIVLVVWESWLRRSCVKRWQK